MTPVGASIGTAAAVNQARVLERERLHQAHIDSLQTLARVPWTDSSRQAEGATTVADIVVQFAHRVLVAVGADQVNQVTAVVRADVEGDARLASLGVAAVTPTTASPAHAAELASLRALDSLALPNMSEVASVAVSPPAAAAATAPPAAGGEPVTAPLAGNIFKVHVAVGDSVNAGDVIVILEAMKMETEVRATSGGTVTAVMVKEGDTVAVGDVLVDLG